METLHMNEEATKIYERTFSYAVLYSQMDIVKCLAKYIDVKQVVEHNNLLCRVIKKNDIDVMKFLLDSGCEANCSQAIKEAVESSHKDSHIDVLRCIDRYIKNKQEAYTDDLLFSALKNDNTDMFNFLISKGCNVNSIDGNARSILQYAVEKNDEKTVELLIKKGADVNYTRDKYKDGHYSEILNYALDNNCNDRILAMIAENIKELFPNDFLKLIGKIQKKVELLNKFIEKLGVSYANGEGTILIWGLKGGLPSEVIENLIQKTPDYRIDFPDSKDQNKRTALEYAFEYVCENDYEEKIINLLIERSNPTTKSKCLMKAIKAQDEDMVIKLIDNGADVNYIEDPDNPSSKSIISVALRSLLDSRENRELSEDSARNILDILLQRGAKYVQNIESLIKHCPIEIKNKLEKAWNKKMSSSSSDLKQTTVQPKTNIGWGVWDVFRFSSFYKGNTKNPDDGE